MAEVVGYVGVAHGNPPFASAPTSAGGVGTLNVYVTDAPPANATTATRRRTTPPRPT
ncbi:MAG TPA: hypothetical protein HA326_02555 [Thermoplasmata archaeon]|nr:hypothetical protein [Thermoplasmata archaeon]